MTEIPTFQPDATPSTYTITFSETLSPYARWFYERTGKPDETMEVFLARVLTDRGKEYLRQMVQQQIADQIMAAVQQGQAVSADLINGIGE